MLSDIIFGVIAMTMAVVFYLVPIVKLVPILKFRAIPLAVVVLIGVVMMVYEFIETIRESKKNRER